MYSGNQTTTKPFSDETTVTGGAAEDILFDLVDAADTVTIEIYDSDDNLVRTMTVTGGTAGTNTVAWDGLDDSGTAVADGDYYYVISATDTAGDAVASYSTYRGGDGNKQVIYGRTVC